MEIIGCSKIIKHQVEELTKNRITITEKKWN